VIAQIKREFEEAKKADPNIDIINFLKLRGISPGYNPLGKDNPVKIDAESVKKGVISMERIGRPTFKPTGDVHALAILIDFEDNVANTPVEHFTELLFSDGSFPTGSLRDYYKTVSSGKVSITGQVSGWHRMPQPYSYYVDNTTGEGSPYPHNAKRMVEDAVVTALKKDKLIQWDKYDINNDGMVDALYVVHAGPGAENQMPSVSSKYIWSHKSSVQNSVKVTNKTSIVQYLTVPEDGYIGVYAHETGHLIFGWPDLYDSCPVREELKIAGLGQWCLMAAGSWNGDGKTPAYPSAWCRYVQGWPRTNVISGKQNVTIPSAEESDEVYVLPIKGKPNEYFILECRKERKEGFKFDLGLPGEGLLIYHIDENADNNCKANHLAVGVVEGDGQEELQHTRIGIFGNQGDTGDPFPGSTNRTYLNSDGFPNSKDYDDNPTGISISNIMWDEKKGTATISLS
jgi:immune inhibitor A